MTSKSLLETLNPKGHLEIIKRYSNGLEETVLDDHNIITVGMGITLASLFSNTTSTTAAEKFSIGYFQIGDQGVTMASSLTQLAGPIDASEYGNTDLTISAINIGGTGGTVVKDSAYLNPQYIKKNGNKVTYSLVLDEQTANSIAINEIGLFSRDPLLTETASVPPSAYLCCYRSFTAITKTEAFVLIFKWTLEF